MTSNRYLIPGIILLAGIGIAALLFMSSSKAKRDRPPPKPMRVEVVEAVSEAASIEIQTTGVVEAAEHIVLTPQVSGRIASIAQDLRPGRRFQRNEVIARIDTRDYQIALKQQEARLQQAELELALEEGRQEVALREWELLGGENDSALALRAPHLVAARTAYEAAQSAVEKAQLDLSRTTLRAPFNAMVATETIDVGQVVGPGTQAATLLGTDRFWITVTVAVEQLAAIHIPDMNHEKVGSIAQVTHQMGRAQSVVREGYVVGLAGPLDPQTRKARIIVAVDAPLDPADAELPLLPGAFVQVAIQGRIFENSFRIPRLALDGEHRVWIVDEEGLLRPRDVVVAWRERDTVVVSEGLDAGDQIVTSRIAIPVEGLPVTVHGDEEHAPSTSDAADAAQEAHP